MQTSTTFIELLTISEDTYLSPVMCWFHCSFISGTLVTNPGCLEQRHEQGIWLDVVCLSVCRSGHRDPQAYPL